MLYQGPTKFPKIQTPAQNSTCQKGKFHTDNPQMRAHKMSQHSYLGKLAQGICAPLHHTLFQNYVLYLRN